MAAYGHSVSRALGAGSSSDHWREQNPQYDKTLNFNVYRFSVTAADTGRVREAVIKAYRGELLLTNFRVRLDGALTGVEVADLDNNRFPELYLYSTATAAVRLGEYTPGKFLPERFSEYYTKKLATIC